MVTRIEKIVGGVVVQRAERGIRGLFVCFHRGTNMDPVTFSIFVS